jgi:hypothetical protein
MYNVDSARKITTAVCFSSVGKSNGEPIPREIYPRRPCTSSQRQAGIQRHAQTMRM